MRLNTHSLVIKSLTRHRLYNIIIFFIVLWLLRDLDLTFARLLVISHQRVFNVDRHRVDLSMHSVMILRCHFNIARACDHHPAF